MTTTPTYDLILEGSYKSLKHVEWKNIPDFAVLTGENGVGKTQLFESLNGCFSNTKKEFYGLQDEYGSYQIKLESNLLATAGEVRFLSNSDLRPRVNASSNVDHVKEKEKSVLEGFKQWKESGFTSAIDPYNRNLYFSLAESLSKDVSLLSDEDISGDNTFKFVVGADLFQPQIADYILYCEKKERENEDAYARFCTFAENLPHLTPADFKTKHPNPCISINILLEKFHLPFQLITEKFGNSLQLYLKRDDLKINWKDLSSGQQVLFSLVGCMFNVKNGLNFTKLLLLDEPDATLHPTVTRTLVDAIQQVLVKECKIKVIMTTHSPSTIALVPEDSIFEMHYGEQTIQKISKDKAISILTDNQLIVKNHLKLIYVEDINDKNFYETAFKKIASYISVNPHLTFIPASLKVNKEEKCETCKYDSGGKCRVIKYVQSHGRDTDYPFYGLIDGDNDSSQIDRIFKIKRHSLENYLLDPIVFREQLLNWGKPLKSAVEETKSAVLLTQKELQTIVDEILQNVFEKCFDKDPFKEVTNPSEKFKIDYLNGISVTVPKWFLTLRGHDLFLYFNDLFKTLDEEQELNPYELIKTFEKLNFIPTDLKELFEEIQQAE